jgi:hypothetical protein
VREALALDANEPAALAAQARIAMRRGKLREATQLLSDALSQTPQEPVLRLVAHELMLRRSPIGFVFWLFLRFYQRFGSLALQIACAVPAAILGGSFGGAFFDRDATAMWAYGIAIAALLILIYGSVALLAFALAPDRQVKLDREY